MAPLPFRHSFYSLHLDVCHLFYSSHTSGAVVLKVEEVPSTTPVSRFQSHFSCLMAPVLCPLSHIPCLTSSVSHPHHPPSHTSCLISPVSCPLSHIPCLTSPVSHPLPHVFVSNFLSHVSCLTYPVSHLLSPVAHLLSHISSPTSSIFHLPCCRFH